MNASLKSCTLAAALVAAASLAACHDSGSGSTPTPTPVPTIMSENFSTLATTTFKAQANSTPVNFDNLTIVYDVNDDATAFAALFSM